MIIKNVPEKEVKDALTIKLGGKTWQSLRQGTKKLPDWYTKAKNQETGLKTCGIWRHKVYSKLRRALLAGAATATPAAPTPGVDVHVVNLSRSEVNPKQLLHYSAFGPLVSFRVPHVLVVELAYEEEMPGEILKFVTTEAAESEGDYPALIVVGEEVTVKTVAEELEREGRSDLHMVQICRRWTKDDPPMGPARGGERGPRRTALLAGELRRDIYPFTYLDDPKDIGQVEILFFLRMLALPEMAADNEPVRVLCRGHPGRTSEETLLRCAFISGALGDSFETVCLCEDPAEEPDLAESFDISSNMADILERATQRMMAGYPSGVNMICDMMRQKEKAHEMRKEADKTAEKTKTEEEMTPRKDKDKAKKESKEKDKQAKKERQAPLRVPDPEPETRAESVAAWELAARNQRAATALAAAKRAGAVDEEERRSERHRTKTDKYQSEAGDEKDKKPETPKTPKPRTKRCARSKPPACSVRCLVPIHGGPATTH